MRHQRTFNIFQLSIENVSYRLRFQPVDVAQQAKCLRSAQKQTRFCRRRLRYISQQSANSGRSLFDRERLLWSAQVHHQADEDIGDQCDRTLFDFEHNFNSYFRQILIRKSVVPNRLGTFSHVYPAGSSGQNTGSSSMTATNTISVSGPPILM